MKMRFLFATYLTMVLFSFSSNAHEMAPGVKKPEIPSGTLQFAGQGKGKIGDFRLLAEGSRVNLQVEMTISVEQTPTVITWALECIEPGPNRIGENRRILATQASDVSQSGQFRISASFTRKRFFDCYAYGDGPDLNVTWEEEGKYVTKKDSIFGDMIRRLSRSGFDGVRVQGFADSDFSELNRWRKIHVLLGREVSKAWPLVADDLELVILETRKTVLSGEVYQSDVEFAVDDTGLKILFAYFDEKGPEFRSYEYRVAWHRAGDKVFRESAEWRRGDWEVISIDWPLEVYRIDIEVDSKTAYSEVIVEISCDYFDEKRSQVGEITTTPGPLIELTFGCNRNTPVSYKVTARSRDGETFLTRMKPLDGDYIYVHEKMFAQE